MWWDVRGGWWTKWTKSFVEGRLKIENSMYTCFTLHLRKNTNNQCSVQHTSAYVKQDGGGQNGQRALCRGGRAHGREHLPWERRHIRRSSAFQAAWKKQHCWQTQTISKVCQMCSIKVLFSAFSGSANKPYSADYMIVCVVSIMLKLRIMLMQDLSAALNSFN